MLRYCEHLKMVGCTKQINSIEIMSLNMQNKTQKAMLQKIEPLLDITSVTGN